MKRMILLLAGILLLTGLKAQDSLSLRLELVNPSGKLDGESYFLARLKNHSDSLRMLFGSADRLVEFIKIYDDVDDVFESSLNWGDQGFFDFSKKKLIVIEPNSEYTRKLPIFIAIGHDWNQGIFPYEGDIIRKTKRLKIKLEGLVFLPQPQKLISVALLPKSKSCINLESNWLDVDTEAIARLVEKP